MVDRWRGRLPELRDRSMFLDVTGNVDTGWKAVQPTGFSGLGSMEVNTVRGQNGFANFYGAAADWVDLKAGSQGKTLFIADEGLASERRTIVDLYSLNPVYQAKATLFDALFPGFHTIRWIQGVDKNASAAGTNMHADALLTR